MNNKKRIGLLVLTILLVIGAGVFAGYAIFERYYKTTSYEEFETVVPEEQPQAEDAQSQEEQELEALYGKTQRVNILLAGIEGERTDTLMVFSFDQKNNVVDIISVPRDTYVELGFSDPGRRKINSVYGYPDSKGGMQGTARAVSQVLGIPIHDYASVDYEVVKAIVDELGGIDVDIPFRMKYDDPYADPPLHINFQQGPAHLDGADAIKYLRWRKNNNDNGDGDIGRIKRQQDFVLKAISKALNPLVLPNVITAGLQNTKTSLELREALFYGSKATAVKSGDINAYSIPGTDDMRDGLWYFIHDPVATRQMMRDLYNGIKPKVQDEQTE